MGELTSVGLVGVDMESGAVDVEQLKVKTIVSAPAGTAMAWSDAIDWSYCRQSPLPSRKTYAVRRRCVFEEQMPAHSAAVEDVASKKVFPPALFRLIAALQSVSAVVGVDVGVEVGESVEVMVSSVAVDVVTSVAEGDVVTSQLSLYMLTVAY